MLRSSGSKRGEEGGINICLWSDWLSWELPHVYTDLLQYIYTRQFAPVSLQIHWHSLANAFIHNHTPTFSFSQSYTHLKQEKYCWNLPTKSKLCTYIRSHSSTHKRKLQRAHTHIHICMNKYELFQCSLLFLQSVRLLINKLHFDIIALY